MTPLRQRMIHEMQVHQLAPSTQYAYLNSVEKLAGHYHQSPDSLSVRQISDFMRACMASHLLICRQPAAAEFLMACTSSTFIR